MAKRLLLTGHGGFVAGSILWHARQDWKVHALSLTEPPGVTKHLTTYQFDLRDAEQLRNVFEAARPDAVIHMQPWRISITARPTRKTPWKSTWASPPPWPRYAVTPVRA